MKSIKEMSLAEKIGQLLVCGYMEDDLSGMLEMIEKYKVGNIILFIRNIKDAESLMINNQILQKKALDTQGVPLFISVDQEGGMVTRIMKDATFFPGNMAISATNCSENAYIIGKMMGEEMNTLGVNLNLAPVLDVNNNPKNPVIGVRSYGDKPEFVSKFGTEFINGLQESGVLSTGKHFPGHGDTSVDSHVDLTEVNHDKKRLNEIELYPFKEAIKTGISAIMSAHVLFPAYEDEKLPATLSKKVLTTLLREELGFTGLIITDCMEMKAIGRYFTFEQAIIKAVEAGANLLCISHTKSKQVAAFKTLMKAVEDGTLEEEIIDRAVERILLYKEKIASHVDTLLTRKNVKLNLSEHEMFAQDINDKAITKVRGGQFIDKGKILCIAPNPVVTTIADDALDNYSLIKRINKSFPHWDTMELKIRPSISEQIEIINKVNEYDNIVFCSYNAHIYREQIDLINKIQDINQNIHLIILRNPYDALEVSVPNCICSYEYTPHAINSIIKYLKNELEPTGKLPVKLEY